MKAVTMTTNRIKTGNKSQQVDAVSSDLSQIVGEQTLLKLALDSIQTLSPALLQEAARRMPDFRPQMMLTLLTYSYSSSIYGSKDIEWAVENDRTVRYICARTRPDWQSLRRFRRQNRELLFQALLYVMKQTWALKFDNGDADYVGYEWFEGDLLERLNQSATERLDVAALMDGAESE
jgi:transposase